MQEQARYLQARLSQGTVAANQLLCMHAKGEGRFAEQVLQKLEEKERLSLLAHEEEKEDKKRSVPSPTEDKPSPMEDKPSPTETKPSPTEDKNNKEEEAPKKKKAKKAHLSTHAVCSV